MFKMKSKKTASLIAAIAMSATLFSQAPPDTICGHKVNRDKEGKILGWYKPEIPGMPYDKVVRLASEYIKSGCPVDPSTGKKVFYTHCSIIKDKSNQKEFKAGETGGKGKKYTYSVQDF